MKKRQLKAEMEQTIALFSGKIDQATPCGDVPNQMPHHTRKATEKIDRAVKSAAERAVKKDRL